jgi:hypothetical protein
VAYDDNLLERKAIEDKIAETMARFLNKGFVKPNNR